MITKQLIINGDDFGLSSSVNQAIIQAHTQGILTSTSLMVTGKAAQEAVELAKQYPNLGVGLHLVLVCGRSQLSPAEISNLVDENGNFADDPVKAGLSYQFNAQAKQELVKEIRAQLIAFEQTGLPLSHLDGHLHLHSHPVVLNILKDLAPEFKINFIRLPYEELGFNPNMSVRRVSPLQSKTPINIGNSAKLLTKFIQSQVFSQLRFYGENILKKAGIMTPDRVYGLLQTGNINEGYLLHLLPQIEASTVEIYSHPDCLANKNNPNGPIELKALLSRAVRDRLESCSFELVNYHQITPTKPTNYYLVKTFFLLATLILTQVLGDISLSRGMKDFGTVNPLDLPSLIPLALFLLTNIWIWVAIFFLVGSLILYLTAISRLDLSYVLPIHAFSYVVNAVFAHLLLGEQVSLMRWFSTSIISLGVLLVGISKQTYTQPPILTTPKLPFKSRNVPLFLLPFGLSISKTWLAVIVLSLTDSAGDLFLAMGMKKIGSVGKMKFREVLNLIRQVLTNPAILTGIACQAIAFFTFIAVLSWADISFIRPATALTYISSMIGAKFILKEKFAKEKLVGISLIGLGVVIHQ